MTSKVKRMLLEEAATLDKDFNFKKLQKDNPITDILLGFGFENGHIHGVLPEQHIAENMLKSLLENECGVNINADPLPAQPITPTIYPDDPGTFGKGINRKLPRRIIFTNRQAIGDILMFTCAIRDFKKAFPNIEVQVRSTAMHIWDYNTNINKDKWHEVIDPMRYWKNPDRKPKTEEMIQMSEQAIKVSADEDKPVLLYIGPGKLTNASNRKDLHFANAYRISMETVLGVQISQGPIRPDIYMSETEYLEPPIIEPPYWLITAGEKGDWTCKTFPFAKWQEVVEKLPQIKFVQLGSTGHKHPELSGNNVVNFIGKTQDRNAGIRMLFNLFNNCEGSMGLVSFQMHLAAAFNKPCVVIAGAREPVHFTRYPGQQYLASDGCLPCTITGKQVPTACWFCKIERCPYHTKYGGQEVPLCSDLFSSDDVVKAIMRYYDGGRLDFNKPVGPSKLVNVVKEPQVMKGILSTITPDESKKVVEELTVDQQSAISILNQSSEDELEKFLSSFEGRRRFIKSIRTLKPQEIKNSLIKENSATKLPTPVEVVNENLNKANLWGFEFGGGSLTERDWEFMQGIIEENNVKTVLEFGAGLSTLLLNDLGLDVITLEDKPGWIDKIKSINPNCNIVQWDGVNVPEDIEINFKFDLAFVDGPAGGQSREVSTKFASNHSNLVIVHDAGREWERKWQEMYLEPYFYLAARGGHRCHFWREGQLEPVVFDSSKPFIKVVFNGRGEGGAERSVCWIMEQFVERGYAVQYISPNPQPCGTFRSKVIPGVEFRNDLSLVKEPCDLLLLYTNDWVWEFPKLSEVFSDMKAKRKVMAVNYKAGSIAKLDWCQNWDHYLFLNSTLMKQTNQTGIVMAPPTDLSIYLKNEPNYNGNLKIVRHSSQGDVKYPKNFNEMIYRILTEIPDSEIFLMPAPSFLEVGLVKQFAIKEGRLHVHQKNKPPVNEFLAKGNCFWYALPGGGYSEGGPKVIMEAQASGLPIVADNHSGAIDRLSLTDKGLLGFLCDDFKGHIKALKTLADDITLRKFIGENNKEHARELYNPQLWIDHIINGTVNITTEEDLINLRCDMGLE